MNCHVGWKPLRRPRAPFKPSSTTSQPAGIAPGFFKDATRARLAGLRSPALLAERLHALLDLRARQSPASEIRAQRDVILQRRATAIFHRYLLRREFAHVLSKSITRTDLDDIERRAAHRARIHPQRAADAARTNSRNSTPLKSFRFASTETFFNFAPAPQCNPLANNLNLAEIAAASNKSPRRESRHRGDEQIRAATKDKKFNFPARRKISRCPPNHSRPPVRHKHPPLQPTRSVVCFASGSSRRTTVARETRPAISS